MVSTLAGPTTLVTLTTGKLSVGLDMRRLTGVERADRIRPGSHPGTVGVVVNRAGEWPVLSLAEHLGETPAGGRLGQVVLLEAAGERIGLLVDRVSPAGRTDSDRLGPVPPTLSNGPFAGVALLDRGPLLLLDPDRLLGAGDSSPPAIVNRIRPIAHRRLLTIGQVQVAGGRAVTFGVPADIVTELFDPEPGNPVPWAERHVRELVRWRDRAVPMLDLAVWCGLPTPTTGRRVAIARTAAGIVGFAAGPVVRIQPADEPHMDCRRPLAVDPDKVLVMFDTADRTVVIPDLSQLGQPG